MNYGHYHLYVSIQRCHINISGVIRSLCSCHDHNIYRNV